MSHRAEKSRSFLATSPVKYLSNFLSGSHSDLATLSKHQRAPSDDPSVLPATVGTLGTLGTLSRNNSSRETNSLYGSARSREGIRMGPEEERPENPLVRLEQTFTGYVASLQARKGNVSGRAVLHRSAVDELSVNDLYNKLIESPLEIESSYDLTPDVVFAAFEKFVRIAWREQMGPIMTIKALDALQARAARRVPGEFADFVNFLFTDMAPQNRRAFTALIKLLADLLDGCGNDGDRGALTLAFAELLVDDNSAHNYINLLDKLVEDCDRIFDDGQGSFSASAGPGSSAFESMTSTIRSGKSHTGSMTSNTSSLRRKLGFDTLLRQNSKNDIDSRPSMWRTLSKQNRHAAVAELNLTVGRARSIDAGSTKFRRPGSRDRPPIAGAFDDSSRPTSSHRLETIGEPESEEVVPQSPPRKRRSSLSDLKNLLEATHLEDDEDIDDDDGDGDGDGDGDEDGDRPPLQPLSRMRETSQKFNSGPGGLSPTRIPVSPKTGTGSLRSPRPKEADVAFTDPFRAAAAADAAQRRGHTKTLSMSTIPTLKASRSVGAEPLEFPFRPTSSPTKPPPPPGKLRLQSPQKLRERLQVEKKAVEDVDASLQTELSRIAADMARVNAALPRSPTGDLRKLSLSVAALEERLPAAVAHLADRQDALRRDVEGTLRATESKFRAVDQLYRESTAENELLYERFNAELAKIVRALKGRGREDKEELMARMRDASEETARVKKENARLRREMASLRALFRGGPATPTSAGLSPGTGPGTSTGTGTGTGAGTSSVAAPAPPPAGGAGTATAVRVEVSGDA